MASVIITNIAKEAMISAISGSDLKIAIMSASSLLGLYDDWWRMFRNWSQLSAYEVSANGSYIQGGFNLSSISAYSKDISASVENAAWFDGDSIVWPNVTVSATGLVIYRSTSGMIIEIIRFDDYQVARYGSFSVSWNNNHIMKMIG